MEWTSVDNLPTRPWVFLATGNLWKKKKKLLVIPEGHPASLLLSPNLKKQSVIEVLHIACVFLKHYEIAEGCSPLRNVGQLHKRKFEQLVRWSKGNQGVQTISFLNPETSSPKCFLNSRISETVIFLQASFLTNLEATSEHHQTTGEMDSFGWL